MSQEQVDARPRPAQLQSPQGVARAPYGKPELQRLGLLRSLTRFSF